MKDKAMPRQVRRPDTSKQAEAAQPRLVNLSSGDDLTSSATTNCGEGASSECGPLSNIGIISS